VRFIEGESERERVRGGVGGRGRGNSDLCSRFGVREVRGCGRWWRRVGGIGGENFFEVRLMESSVD